MLRIIIPLGALALGLANQAAAQDTVFNDDVIVTGNLCAGSSCVDGETFSTQGGLKLSSGGVGIDFDDTGGSSSNDWALKANATSEDSIYFEDSTAGTTPFKIIGTAPDNSLFVGADGKIGFGTAVPMQKLHIVSPEFTEVLLESTGDNNQQWGLFGDKNNFVIRDRTNDTIPFFINDNTPTATLFLNESGNVGIGTGNPAGKLEIFSEESFNFFRLTATGATIDSVDITYTNGPLSNGELRYNIVDGDGPEMRLDGDGKLTIVGELVTAGSCSVGCDAVFKEDYALKSIEEHQAQMWSAGYLPNVGPTPEDGPFNVSEKMGRMLNELEHAHIYIGQLHAKIETLEAQAAKDEARFARIETLLAQ